MKNKKNILATVFALILALSVVTASATAAAANGRRSDKIETLPEIISVPCRLIVGKTVAKLG